MNPQPQNEWGSILISGRNPNRRTIVVATMIVKLGRLAFGFAVGFLAVGFATATNGEGAKGDNHDYCNKLFHSWSSSRRERVIEPGCLTAEAAPNRGCLSYIEMRAKRGLFPDFRKKQEVSCLPTSGFSAVGEPSSFAACRLVIGTWVSRRRTRCPGFPQFSQQFGDLPVSRRTLADDKAAGRVEK